MTIETNKCESRNDRWFEKNSQKGRKQKEKNQKGRGGE